MVGCFRWEEEEVVLNSKKWWMARFELVPIQLLATHFSWHVNACSVPKYALEDSKFLSAAPMKRKPEIIPLIHPDGSEEDAMFEWWKQKGRSLLNTVKEIFHYRTR